MDAFATEHHVPLARLDDNGMLNGERYLQELEFTCEDIDAASDDWQSLLLASPDETCASIVSSHTSLSEAYKVLKSSYELAGEDEMGRLHRILKATFEGLNSSRRSRDKGDRVTAAVTKVGQTKGTGKGKHPPRATTTKDATNYDSDEDEVIKFTKSGRCGKTGHSKDRKTRKGESYYGERRRNLWNFCSRDYGWCILIWSVSWQTNLGFGFRCDSSHDLFP